MLELRTVDEGAVPASAPATSQLFVLPVAARRWVSTDNRTAGSKTRKLKGFGARNWAKLELFLNRRGLRVDSEKTQGLFSKVVRR